MSIRLEEVWHCLNNALLVCFVLFVTPYLSNTSTRLGRHFRTPLALCKLPLTYKYALNSDDYLLTGVPLSSSVSCMQRRGVEFLRIYRRADFNETFTTQSRLVCASH